MSIFESVEDIAMVLAGPHNPVPEGSKFTLAQLREVRWNNHLSKSERGQYLQSARALLAEFKLYPRRDVIAGWPTPSKPIEVLQASAPCEPFAKREVDR